MEDGVSAPLVVLNAMVMRAESLPDEGTRQARPKYCVNEGGQGVHDDGTANRTMALTDRPALEWEAFDEYWRKTHGPKILHDEGPDDRGTPLLVFYLQQHRLPGGPTSHDTFPYPAKTGADGRLVPDPAARVAPYRRPSFDGIAQLAFRTKDDVATFFDGGPGKYGDKIIPDEAVFIKGFAFNLNEEHVVIASAAKRRDPIILLKNHVRKKGLTREAFRARWIGAHADLVRSLPQAKDVICRYAQLHNVSEPGDTLYDEAGDRIDGTTAMSFANANDLEDFLASEAYTTLVRDETEFAAESEFYTAINYVIRDAS